MRPPQLGQQVNGYNASGTAYALAGIQQDNTEQNKI